jgi:hypothetical protein
VTLTTLLLLNALVRLKFNAVLAVEALLADAPKAPEFLESPVSLRVEVLLLVLLLLLSTVLVLLLSSVFVLVELSVLVLVLLLSIVLVLFSVLVLLLVSVLVFVLVLLSVLTLADESPAAEALVGPLAVEVPALLSVGSAAPATPDRPSARAKAAVVMMTFFMTSS